MRDSIPTGDVSQAGGEREIADLKVSGSNPAWDANIKLIDEI